MGRSPSLKLLGAWVLATLPLACGQSGSFRDKDPAAQEPKSTVAFLVYDAGETLALLPVAEWLGEAGVVVNWIPLTPWAADLLAENGREPLSLPEGVETMPHVQGREEVPETGYWEEYLARDPPALAILGMVSAAQGQLAAWLHDAGIPTRGYVDGFQVTGPQAVSARLARGWPGNELAEDPPGAPSVVAGSPTDPFDEIWVATGRVQEGFRVLGIPTRVAGQPTLESWRRGADDVDPEEVRRIQGLAPDDRILLWAGQYGEGYPEVLDGFLGAVAPVLAADSSLTLVLSHHPRTHGEVERGALEPVGIPGIMMMSEDLTTMEMATTSDVILTWTSTVATQAAFMGKPSVYYSPPEGFDTHLVEVGAAFRADATSLPGILKQLLDHPRASGGFRQTLLDAGYVLDADRRMADMVLEGLGAQGPRAPTGAATRPKPPPPLVAGPSQPGGRPVTRTSGWGGGIRSSPARSFALFAGWSSSAGMKTHGCLPGPSPHPPFGR